MISSGRKRQHRQEYVPSPYTRGARMTAILGALVFTVFLCLSVNEDNGSQNAGNTFGEGAYQVFAPADDTESPEEDVASVEDSSIWAYLEDAIARLIYGER